MDPDLLTRLLGSDRDPTADPGDALATTDQIRTALHALPPEQSRPVVLMTFYGLTAKNIAEREGIPIGTVKTRVRRGLGAMRERLGARDD
jgi:RNA polymerase sigma-70 factor (ECF subfamily)